jgi:hypothetical protein
VPGQPDSTPAEEHNAPSGDNIVETGRVPVE